MATCYDTLKVMKYRDRRMKLRTGEELALRVYEDPHGVRREWVLDGKVLPNVVDLLVYYLDRYGLEYGEDDSMFFCNDYRIFVKRTWAQKLNPFQRAVRIVSDIKFQKAKTYPDELKAIADMLGEATLGPEMATDFVLFV